MPAKYSNYLEINPSFESVVDIDADRRNQNLWQEYIVGKDMEDLMEALCQSLGNEAPDARRSFWINGSYGTGKSYAGIFVKHLMEEKPDVVETFLSKDPRLSKFKNRFSKCRRNGDYLVVWKTGCTGIRTGDMMLIESEKAVRDALIDKFGDKAKLGSGSLLDAVREKLNDPTINWEFMLSTTTLGDDYDSVEDLRESVESGEFSAIQAAAAALRQKNIGLVNNLETFRKWIGEIIDENGLAKSGIFLIWDEFTEYVAYSDDHTVMQQISEFCKVKPFFTFFIVHKSTDLVTRVGGEDQYQLIIEGIVMCFVLLVICVVGIANGPVGLVVFYEQEVQDRVVELGLITREKIKKTSIITVAALFIPMLVLVPLMVYGINGTKGFWDGFWQMLAILMIGGLFDRLFIDWWWVGHTKAWVIPGTEDLMPYIYGKTLIKKWLGTLVGFPILAAILAGIIQLF